MVESWQGVSILIVGCGSIGKRHARLLKRMGVRDLRACDPLPEQREALFKETPGVKIYGSFDEGLKDGPQAVLIGTPPKTHIPLAMQALSAGCHVLCEKPLSDSTRGIEALAGLSSQTGKKTMVALCFRYHEGLREAKRLLDGGAIGRLVSIRSLMGEHLPTVRSDFRSLFTSRYSGAFDLTHDIDLAIWFAGKPVRRVLSMSGNYSDIGIQAPDCVEILIDFAERCIASIHLDFFQKPRRRQMELIGTEGVIIIDFARWDKCILSTFRSSTEAWTREEMLTDRDDMFIAEDLEFLKAITEDTPFECTIGEALKSVEVVETSQAMARGLPTGG